MIIIDSGPANCTAALYVATPRASLKQPVIEGAVTAGGFHSRRGR